MHRIALLLLYVCSCCAAFQSRAQSAFPVSGMVSDTLNNAKLQYASIVLIRTKDSTLATFARTDAAGKFVTAAVAPGKYKLLVTYPGFADFTERGRGG